jgi:hypothetical protein
MQLADIVQQLMTILVSGMHSNEVPNRLLKASHILRSQRVVYKDCIPFHNMWKQQGKQEYIDVQGETIRCIVAYTGIYLVHHCETVSQDITKFKLG